MTSYIFNETLSAFADLAVKRARRGLGAVLLLSGIPGGGKTTFAKALAEKLGGKFFRYQSAPDRERNLLYHVDVDGVLKRESGWLPGPAWEAFMASGEGFVVLLIDEVDKTNPNFDAFLLELLEEFQFRAPGNGWIRAIPSNMVIVLTSNGRRTLRPEVLRRCQRIEVPFPERPRLDAIIRQIATGIDIPEGLLDLVIRMGEKLRIKDKENSPSPKEMALCLIDILELSSSKVFDPSIWRSVVASYLIKEGGAEAIDKVVGFRWTRALIKEAKG